MEDKEDNVHPVVRLLVARMESHPEEFDFHERFDAPVDATRRWENIIDRAKRWATEKEIDLLARPYMDAIHRDALDELMNGPERRAEEERIRQEEHRRWMKAAQGTAGGSISGAGLSGVADSTYYNQLRNALPGTIIPVSQMENQGVVAKTLKALGLK